MCSKTIEYLNNNKFNNKCTLCKLNFTLSHNYLSVNDTKNNFDNTKYYKQKNLRLSNSISNTFLNNSTNKNLFNNNIKNQRNSLTIFNTIINKNLSKNSDYLRQNRSCAELLKPTIYKWLVKKKNFLIKPFFYFNYLLNKKLIYLYLYILKALY